MNLTLIPSDFDGPGQYRLLQPGRELQHHGHQVALPQFGITRNQNGDTVLVWDIKRTGIPDTDLYILQGSNISHWPDLIQGLQAKGRKVIYEIDDSHTRLPHWHPAAGTDWTVFNHNVSLADHVTVATPALRDEYQHLNPRITILPNYLDWNMWENTVPVQTRRVRVGYMGSTVFHRYDLMLLNGIIEPFLHANPQVEFVAAGDPLIHDVLGVPQAQRVTAGKVSYHEKLLPQITATMHIGLVPLVGNHFNQAKSYLKGLEYAACHIPCVCTPTEQYLQLVEHGVNGFHARSPRDWRKYLDLLVNDHDLREEMGRNARQKARTMTIQQHYVKWEALYEQVLRDDHHPHPARPQRAPRRVPRVNTADRMLPPVIG